MAVGAPPVPIDAGVGTGTEAFSAALGASPAEDNFRAFFMVTTQGSLSEKLVEVRRTQGAWPDTHVIAESTAIQPSWSVAVNSDGTREAAWLNTENGGELPLSGDGGWSSTILSQVAGAPELGFTRDGGACSPSSPLRATPRTSPGALFAVSAAGRDTRRPGRTRSASFS